MTIHHNTTPQCLCCDSEAETVPVTVFKPYAGGWHQGVVLVCRLCAEEIENGNNPLYKPTRNLLAA